MKTIKLTLASLLALLFSAAVSMASPANNFVLEAIEKPLLLQVFKIAKALTELNPKERQTKYQLDTFTLNLISRTDQETPAFIRETVNESFHTFYSNIISILDDFESNLISSEQVDQLKPLSPLLPESIFSLYLIPALKRGEKGMIEALMATGANFHELKCITQESGEDEFIKNLIDDYQSKQKKQSASDL